MRTHTRPAATAALFVSLASASIITAGAAGAAPAPAPDLAVTSSPQSGPCGVAITNKGTATAVAATLYTPSYGGLTTTLGDIAPGATKTTGYIDCAFSPLPMLVIASAAGDSNPFNNATFIPRR